MKKMGLIRAKILGTIVINGIFIGCFPRNVSKADAERNFIKNEQEFSSLVYYFESILPDSGKYNVKFGIGKKKDQIDLVVFPLNSDPIIGGDGLELNSPQLDSTLALLQWDKETLTTLKTMLSKTNCQWIRTTDFYGQPIEIYFRSSGMGSYSYYVFQKPINDSLIQTHGKPIGDSSFGLRVVLKYSSAL
jgi:hypothetical protein